MFWLVIGKGTKTIDPELEQQIELLKDTQRKYSDIIRLGRAFSNHFMHAMETQRALGDAFSGILRLMIALYGEWYSITCY